MMASYPGEVWIVDTLFLHETNKGNKYMMVAVDRFTNAWEMFPCREDIPENFARFYYWQIFPRWGAARMVHTDRG